MRSLKPAAALALTGIGSALVIGFQVPEVPAATTTTAAATTTTTSADTSVSTTTEAPSSTGTTTTTDTSASATAAPATTDTSSAVAVAAAAAYADGIWTGAGVEEPWGTFQVQAVVSGGLVTDVVVISAPTDGHSSRINDQAIPMLTEAAIAAQSADIDMLSGATWTSRSYATSLQAALDDAAAAAEQAA